MMPCALLQDAWNQLQLSTPVFCCIPTAELRRKAATMAKLAHRVFRFKSCTLKLPVHQQTDDQ